ncbi:hypothetical protein OEZ85_011088 [Tetradesmus obliquus]|uniref:Uncharacterized protein n=1 Tax=Tetradesmus obliquus TaxID=3088 RepID=A0ABY8TR10_TETOB|nr:hypothetical protein OEZ85_010970 [Tetradesmus obliquus]WIA10923.1 hypothetical protein OEZ85_011088 [Tetradesmus obliquus]
MSGDTADIVAKAFIEAIGGRLYAVGAYCGTYNGCSGIITVFNSCRGELSGVRNSVIRKVKKLRTSGQIPQRKSRMSSVEENLRSLSPGLLSWLADTPKSIISGGANSRNEKIYAKLGADKFRPILDTPSRLTIEDAFTIHAEAAPAPDPAAMDIVPSSGGGSSSSRDRGKRALEEVLGDDDDSVAIVLVKELGGDLRDYMKANDARHAATNARLDEVASAMKVLAKAVHSSVSAQYGNAYQAPITTTTTMASVHVEEVEEPPATTTAAADGGAHLQGEEPATAADGGGSGAHLQGEEPATAADGGGSGAHLQVSCSPA